MLTHIIGNSNAGINVHQRADEVELPLWVELLERSFPPGSTTNDAPFFHLTTDTSTAKHTASLFIINMLTNNAACQASLQTSQELQPL